MIRAWALGLGLALGFFAGLEACGARSQLGDAGETGGEPAEAGIGGRDAATDVVLDAPPDRTIANPDGCADGAREAFRDDVRYPSIAGCAGAFRLPGVNPPPAPSCGREAGDDSTNPNGIGCAASDLCAEGWHVCASEAEVASRSVDGCAGARDADPGSFFATQQSGSGCRVCATGEDPDCANDLCGIDCLQTQNMTNDIFGCGNVGSVPDVTCGVLDRAADDYCAALPNAWLCPSIPNGWLEESLNVTKLVSVGGGVLCCTD